MSLFVASLNSGSNGNCYYAGTQEDGVLIDAGISCRETERRLKRLELSIRRIRAIFITHEHGDHIAGLARLSAKHRLPVYITRETHRNSNLNIESALVRTFTPNEVIPFGELTVTAIPKVHDAADPHSFVVSSATVRVGVFTDHGHADESLRAQFATCHAAFLECNYDAGMLEHGGYPLALKNRIRGGKGHLSNTEALALFLQHRPPFMTHLFPSHLSAHNNAPALVKRIFEGVAGNTEIVIASRHKETELYHIRHLPGFRNLTTTPKTEQLSLF